MVENANAFFYLGKSSTETRIPQMLDILLSRLREITLANMKQSTTGWGNQAIFAGDYSRKYEAIDDGVAQSSYFWLD
jgi:hypothetical protein